MRQRSLWIWIVAGTAALLAGVFWLGTLDQPLIDRHEFRQTQTALSAMFMQPGLQGLLHYQTPVLGAPWSIPFEFPLLQWLSHQLASLTGMNLSSSGRLLSVLFGVGCLWPASHLMRRAGLGGTSIAVLILLYCTSSIYLYWNRAFLMESTALFFTLISLDGYSQIRVQRASASRKLILLICGLGLTLAVALVVKATTAHPALALMGIDWIWQTHQATQGHRPWQRQLLIASALAVTFALLYSWTHHADALKQLNPIGAQLTSSALKAWNFGQPSQRLQAELWDGVVLQRMLFPIAALPIIGLIAGGGVDQPATHPHVSAGLFGTGLCTAVDLHQPPHRPQLLPGQQSDLFADDGGRWSWHPARSAKAPATDAWPRLGFTHDHHHCQSSSLCHRRLAP